MSLWTIGDHGVANMEDAFEGDPQLLCDIKHEGDVLDLQVSFDIFALERSLWISKKYVQLTEYRGGLMI